MTAKELIEQIEQYCAGNFNREVRVKTKQLIDVGGPDQFRWKPFTFETHSPWISTTHPSFLDIEIPPQ